MKKILVLACLSLSLVTVACKNSGKTASSNIAVIFNGKPITYAELDAKIPQIEDRRAQVLDIMILDLAAKAKKLGISGEQYQQQLSQQAFMQVRNMIPPTTDKEAEEFFNENKDKIPFFKNKIFSEIKNKIVEGMQNAKMQQNAEAVRQMAFGIMQQQIQAIKDEVKPKVEILYPQKKELASEQAPPVERKTVAAAGVSKGSDKAPITIVEFSDFQCPYCARGRLTVDEMLKEFDGKVRVVFRQLPLPMHDEALKAAEASLCANDQGKFWALHDWMFANQKSLKVEQILEAAGSLQIDKTKLEDCLKKSTYAGTVRKDISEVSIAKMNGAPGFVIGATGANVEGAFLNGALPAEKFRETILAELAKLKK